MLSKRFKELEIAGILIRHVYPETPVRIKYELTERVVSGLEEALTHIRAHSTKHSECIITEDDRNALHE